MILRRPNSKDFVADRNSDICGSPIHEKFRRIGFHESQILKNCTGISFLDSTFLGTKKEFNYTNLAKIREIRENFFP